MNKVTNLNNIIDKVNKEQTEALDAKGKKFAKSFAQRVFDGMIDDFGEMEKESNLGDKLSDDLFSEVKKELKKLL